MLLAMQVLLGSEGLHNGTLADWEAINGCMHTLSDCVAFGQAPDKALRNKDAWSKAVDGCISAAWLCLQQQQQHGLQRSVEALLSVVQRLTASAYVYDNALLVGLTAAISLNKSVPGSQSGTLLGKRSLVRSACTALIFRSASGISPI